MAKHKATPTEHQILGTILLGTRSFRAGDEAAFADAIADQGLTTEDLNRLAATEPPVLAGDWSELATPAKSSAPNASELTSIADLPALLQTLTTVDAVLDLQAKDKRKSATPAYEARLKELASKKQGPA